MPEKKKKRGTKTLGLNEENCSGVAPESWVRCSRPNKKNQQEDSHPDVIELEKETDRLQVKMFNGNSVKLEEEINDWLREGKEKIVVSYDLGTYTKKSAFSGSKEEEIFFFLVYHYKTACASATET